MDNRKAITAILSMSYVRGCVSGKHYQELLAHQVQYMTDFKNGEKRYGVLRRIWINGLKLYDEKRLVLTGNGNQWMV
jgi:hypothetical protein